MSRFSALGGHRVLDLINTVDWRLDPSRRSDRLTDAVAAHDWGLEFGHLTAREHEELTGRLATADATAALAAVVEIRERTYEILFDQAHREAARRYLGAALPSAVRACELVNTGTGWIQRETDLDAWTLRHRLVRDAVAFITSTPAERLGQCADDSCGWVFLDGSPRRNRRWCSSASCGNRHRVRRHQERSAEG